MRNPAPKKKSVGMKVGIGCGLALVVLALLGACVTILSVATNTDPEPGTGWYATPSAPPAPPTTAATSDTAPVLVDGTWTAADDVPAGTWRSRGVPTDGPIPGCAWTISRDGQPVDGGVTEAGRPTLTLKAGDEVTLTGCGTWDRK